MATDKAAGHVNNGHHQADMPPDVAFESKERDGGNVGGHVEQFGRCRSVEKVVAQKAHEQKNKEAAGAGTKETIIPADDGANGAGGDLLESAIRMGLVRGAEIFFNQGVDQHGHQDERYELAQKGRVDLSHVPGADKTTE